MEGMDFTLMPVSVTDAGLIVTLNVVVKPLYVTVMVFVPADAELKPVQVKPSVIVTVDPSEYVAVSVRPLWTKLSPTV